MLLFFDGSHWRLVPFGRNCFPFSHLKIPFWEPLVFIFSVSAPFFGVLAFMFSFSASFWAFFFSSSICLRFSSWARTNVLTKLSRVETTAVHILKGVTIQSYSQTQGKRAWTCNCFCNEIELISKQNKSRAQDAHLLLIINDVHLILLHLQ